MHLLFETVTKAIKNEHLRMALEKSTSVSIEKRNAQVTEIPDFEKLRETSSQIREKSVLNLRHLLKTFVQNAKSKGFRVHFAQSANEACWIVYRILKDHNASNVVKSKSMTTEEIHLNEFLQNQGIRILETDLGEFIVQLAGEPPAHITAPALHKSRNEIAQLFQKHLNYEGGNKPAQLTRFARDYLRKMFLNAHAGITGANFLIAESGSIVIVENEGNARFTFTMPKLHIVVTGMEKIVERKTEVGKLLRLLAPSATGQRQTSYVSFINKPIDKDVHIVLLDNGRLNIADSTLFRDSMKCIRCGLCSLVCPVFQIVGGQTYLSPYSGPIGIIVTPLISQNPHNIALTSYLCTLCGRCNEVCPVKIDLTDLILKVRNTYGMKTLPVFPKFVVNTWSLLLKMYPRLPKFFHKVLQSRNLGKL